MKNGLFALVLALAMPVLAQSPAQHNDKASAQGQDAIAALPVHKTTGAPASDEDRISREVRHELVMQPYYTIWDWLAFRVNGSTVELLGDVYSNGLKSDAVSSVKHIEGVDKVVDHINLLPPSPMDDRIRKEVARAIFSFGGLSRYSYSAVPSIHIIVNSGRVTLEGVVDSEEDKNAAFLRANGVGGVFQVTNNLRVVKG